MAKKPKAKQPTLLEKLQKIKSAGLSKSRTYTSKCTALQDMQSLEERIAEVFDLCKRHKNNATTMIYFVMYDIENNKIRTHIAKFLKKKGCVRVQKSIFLASTDRAVFNEIYATIKEVQEVYDNHDSVFFVPVSVDQLRAMKIVGQNTDYELIIGNKTTMFF